jgi:hypothetical protein
VTVKVAPFPGPGELAPIWPRWTLTR